MRLTEFLDELSYPLRSTGVVAALAMFFVLTMFVVLAASLVGVYALAAVWLAVGIVVAFMRYLVLIAESRSRDADVAPPGAEYFSLVGNLWTLFPAAVVLSIAFLADELRSVGQPAMAAGLTVLAGALFPATIGILTLTHSALQSINPPALARYIRTVGAGYLYTLAAAALPAGVAFKFAALPAWLAVLLALFSLASFFAVVGWVTRSSGLAEEVGIPTPSEPDADATTGALVRRRTQALNHAYGFASRGNQSGALRHIGAAIDEDPDVESAWSWYFERMLAWEDSRHALAFAQIWLHRLLAVDDRLPAVKLMLRCRLLEPRFKPQPEDIGRAARAAESLGNDELAASLKRL